MNKDFTIVFEKMSEQTPVGAPPQADGIVMLSGAGLAELDELAELRRAVAEITEPEPLSFTTT